MGGPTTAIILVGGEGTRLRPLTLDTPKPVVPVVDRPFLRFQIELLKSAGVRDIVLCVAFRPDRIQDVLGDGAADGVRIRYVHEQIPLGTGGAVKNAEEWIAGRAIVMNGDVLSNIDLPAVLTLHERTAAAATIVLHPVANPSAYGLVETDETGRITRFLEKPKPEEITTNRINAGLYVLEARMLHLIPPGVPHSIERGYFPALIASGERVQAHVHEGYWIDIGTPEKYLQVHLDLLSGHFAHPFTATRRGNGWVHSAATIAPDAVLSGAFYIGPRCVIGPTSRIEDGTTLIEDVTVNGGTVGRSVVWGQTTIGKATLQGALVAHHVTISDNATIRDGALLGPNTVISPYSKA